MKISVKEIAELRWVAYGNRGASGIRRGSMVTAKSPRVAGSLCKKGLLSGLRQSEHVYGERRKYYWIYEVTEAGHAYLASVDSGAKKP